MFSVHIILFATVLLGFMAQGWLMSEGGKINSVIDRL